MTSPDPRLLVWLKVRETCRISARMMSLKLACLHDLNVCGRRQLRVLAFAMQSLRNTTPVPRHWSQKRKYLQVPRLTTNSLDDMR